MVLRNENQVKLIECPRDAMQGLPNFIPTSDKIEYINALLRVGFDTLDFGSFVSPASIPQMKDTAEVVEKIDYANSTTKLLAIVANVRGAMDAIKFKQINYLGFPLSVSETFQKRNTNKSIAEAFDNIEEIQNLCTAHDRTLVVYLSMGFGNPYGDPYHPEILIDFVSKLDKFKISVICPSDTIGISNPKNIDTLFRSLIPAFEHIEFGAHLHSTPATMSEKINAAHAAGCRRFDGALLGFGGCPMANDELTGNIATEMTIQFFQDCNIDTSIDQAKLREALQIAHKIFNHH